MSSDELLKEIQKAGLADEATITKLRRESLLSGRSPESLIFAERLIDDAKLAQLKSSILKVPYKKVDAESIDQKLFEIVGEETARTYEVVPLSQTENMLIVGMVNPDDRKAQEALKFLARRHRLNLGVYLISYGNWQDALRKYSPYRSEVERAVESLRLAPESGRKIVRIEEGGVAEEAPIIRIVADTLKEAVSMRASDIHIEPQEHYLRIRFRVDGDLKEGAALPAEISQHVISRVKVLSSLQLDETRIPQDGRFRTKIFDREIDFRISTFPTPFGEKAAIRVLDPTTGLKNFEGLELSKQNSEIFEAGLEAPFGMILITGPTGSGKTTTLYALLGKLNDESVNIVSLEDPIEYFVPGVNQSQVRPEIGYDFASGLRQILRQDPDVIMVGEVRDRETASLAVQAALTGHIVLSTLHTNNAVSVIPRLVDMGVEPFLLPVSLNLMASQRLIGILCPDCKIEEDAPPVVERAIKKALAELPGGPPKKYAEPYKIYHSEGCGKCRGRGVAGRTAIFEVFRMTKDLAEVISAGVSIDKILKEARNQGMITLRQDGILKALEGKVSIEEVLRETEEL